MLATQRMSSHGGPHSFPFGYDPNRIEGIGLPDFMTPGDPQGQPLLNDHENAQFNNFLSDFDSNALSKQHDPQPQYHMGPGQPQYWNMPPTFVGSETTLGSRSGIDPHSLQMDSFFFPDAVHSHELDPNSHGTFDNHLPGFPDSQYSNPMLNQLQAAPASIQPGYSSGWQHQPYQPQGAPMLTPGRGPTMRFGSDVSFGPSGFAGAPGHVEPEVSQPLDWLESGPNTQPNTQPSSPNWSKKRKLDDYQTDLRNGFKPTASQHFSNQPSPPNSNPRRQRTTVIRHDHQSSISQSHPPTPRTNSKPHSLNNDSSDDLPHDEDAEAEDDDDLSNTLTGAALPSRDISPPAPWPANKARPSKSNRPPAPSKPPRNRKKSSTSASTPLKPRSKVSARPSLSSTPSHSQNASSSRVPLTQEQKKANHTNSEQRRRDATARAYAELYDLVPEVAEMGKQSTMKKLEVVVAKVETVIQRVKTLREIVGSNGGSIGPWP